MLQVVGKAEDPHRMVGVFLSYWLEARGFTDGGCTVARFKAEVVELGSLHRRLRLGLSRIQAGVDQGGVEQGVSVIGVHDETFSSGEWTKCSASVTPLRTTVLLVLLYP